jgi:hypothetical protein
MNRVAAYEFKSLYTTSPYGTYPMPIHTNVFHGTPLVAGSVGSFLEKSLATAGILASHVGSQALWILAKSSNGFDVGCIWGGANFTVFIGQLELHVSSETEAFSLLLFACAPTVRLRTDCLGRRPVWWTLEHRQSDGVWREVLASGYCVWFKRRRKFRSEYRFNQHENNLALPAESTIESLRNNNTLSTY